MKKNKDLKNEKNYKDVSKIKINNKLKNINFIVKSNIFSHLISHVGCVTDLSKAYIPIKKNKTSFINSIGEQEFFTFDCPNEDNNYADLIINNKNINYTFKAVRVKNLSAIQMDGSHITWTLPSISNYNFLVFYSINPSEMNKIILMTTRTYVDLFVSNNNNMGAFLFNSDKIEKYKKAMNVDNYHLKLIDYSKEADLRKDEIINVNIKYNACYKTVHELNKNPKSMINIKTHFGKRYTVYNIKNGRVLNFRDCKARNNFFELHTKVKLSNNHCINRNCKNQDLLVNGDELEKYQMNIFEDDGWVIMNYMPNFENIKEYVQTLLHKLVLFSVKWKNRLQNLLKYFDSLIKVFCDKFVSIHEKLKNKFNYYRPMLLLDYVTCTNNIDMKNYYQKYPYMERFYK